jgi:multimeric flavodoxin WrbA
VSRKVLGIVGSYRKGGIIDTLVSETLNAAQEQGASVEKIYLIDKQIGFCTNCRSCTQEPGSEPGECVQDDDMREMLAKIQQADSLVLASPVNFFDVNAITRRFLERLVCFAYWPWENKGPRLRNTERKKQAVLITSSAMPSILARWFTSARSTLKNMAKTIGAKPIATIAVGMIATAPQAQPPQKAVDRARAAGRKLAAERQ